MKAHPRPLREAPGASARGGLLAPLLVLGLLAVAGCEWRTLPVSGPDPIYLGPEDARALPQGADSLRVWEGFFSYRDRGGLARGPVYVRGGERTANTIPEALAEARAEHPGSFVSDGSVTIRTRTGITGFQFLIMTLFGGGWQTDLGLTETFLLQGTLRTVPDREARDDP